MKTNRKTKTEMTAFIYYYDLKVKHQFIESLIEYIVINHHRGLMDCILDSFVKHYCDWHEDPEGDFAKNTEIKQSTKTFFKNTLTKR